MGYLAVFLKSDSILVVSKCSKRESVMKVYPIFSNPALLPHSKRRPKQYAKFTSMQNFVR